MTASEKIEADGPQLGDGITPYDPDGEGYRAPWGKYKGRPVAELIDDRAYLARIMANRDYKFFVAVHRALQQRIHEARNGNPR